MKKKQSKLTKLNEIIDKVLAALDNFSKAMNKIHLDYDAGDRRLDRITRGLNKGSGVNHDYSILTGK